jgi:hypothetical protein
VALIGGAALGISVLALFVRGLPFDGETRWWMFGVLALTMAFVAWRLHHRLKGRALAGVVPRAERAEPGDTTKRASAARRLARGIAPPISGSLAALTVGATLILTASAFPVVLDLPAWIELEAIFAAWWVVWTTTFVMLLYRGWRIARDLTSEAEPFIPRRGGDGSSSSPDLSGLDFEGILLLLAIFLAFVAAWIVAELVVPLFLLVVYGLLVRGLRRVSGDRHECEGRALRSLAWGAAWATLYTAPLAALTWLVHLAFLAR